MIKKSNGGDDLFSKSGDERALSGHYVEAGTLSYVAGAHAGAHVVGVRGIWKP